MVTIGIAPEADELLNKLKDHFGFNTAKDMALFAFAYAIVEKLPRKSYGSGKTKWGTSSFEDIDFETILKICYPNEEITDPIGVTTELMHAGIFSLNEKVNGNNNLTISELLPE